MFWSLELEDVSFDSHMNPTRYTHVLLRYFCLVYRCACTALYCCAAVLALLCTAVPLCCIRYRENLATVDSALAKYPDEVRSNKARVRDLQSVLKVSF